MSESLAERLTSTLRDRVIMGELAPGTVVIEPALALEFEVSKTPVREALQRLTHDGLIEVLPKRGYLVRTMTPTDLRDVLELRRLLEPVAVRHITEVVALGGPEGEHILRMLEDALEQQTHATSPAERLRTALHFHRTLASLTPNIRMRKPLSHALDESTRALYLLPTGNDDHGDEEGLQEHARLLEAIRSGDAEAAYRASEAHFSRLD